MSQPMSEHRAMQYQRKVEQALQAAKKVLDTTRNPVYPADAPHTYADKYLLAEIATKTAASSVLGAFSTALPRWSEHQATMQAWAAANKTVTLQSEGSIQCKFVKTTERTVESATEIVTTTKSSGGRTKEQSTTLKTTIVEHFWKVGANWEVSAYAGADPNDKVVLATGAGAVEQVTRGDRVNKPTPPRPEVSGLAKSEVDICWLLSAIAADSEGGVQFAINRDASSCKTPRRNDEVDAAIKAVERIRNFAQQSTSNVFQQIFRVDAAHGVRGSNHQSIFSPTLAMFSFEEVPAAAGAGAAEGGAATTTASNGSTLSSSDLSAFLAEHGRSMQEQMEKISAECPTSEIITPLALGIVTILSHTTDLCSDYTSAVGAVEAMLRAQLIAAIGKEVQPKDFAEYMDFHNRKLFKAEHAPERFCYAIRREGRYPDGTVSIEQAGGDNMPLLTSVVKQQAVRPMKIALNAATEVSFMGDRYVHAAIMHSFSGQNAANLKLVARAKQFSSFVLLAGKLTAADQFEPTAAVIVKDKDDLAIPLLLETIPTPKEFRDAIESLSPEQQRFAKAYRSLQLSSTLFGVCIIQVKPQLERVLNLPDNSLTKEIQLTQDLMELFIKYQVPSDLLSYDSGDSGDEAAEESQATKLAAVKAHVAQIQGVIAAQREAELLAAAEEKAKALLEANLAAEAAALQQQQQQYEQGIAYASRGAARGNARGGGGGFGGGGGGGGGGGMKKMASKSMSRGRRAEAMPMMARAEAMPMARSMAMPMMAMDCESAAPIVPPPPQPQQQQQQQPGDAAVAATEEMDYTALPTLLDSKFSELDTDNALRPTIIKTGATWTRTSQAGLLSNPTTSNMREAEQKEAKNMAFDLLDALTRSGVLAVAEASLHVVLAATHCFDKTVVNAVVQDNVNPVEKVERSVLIVSSAISGKSVAELVKPDQLDRVLQYSPVFAAVSDV